MVWPAFVIKGWVCYLPCKSRVKFPEKEISYNEVIFQSFDIKNTRQYKTMLKLDVYFMQ
jgi:hypothetical protein